MPWAIADRTTLSQRTAELILSQIKEGVFRPGDALPSQRAMARMMGVGVSAVREALQRLEVLGVVEVRHGKSTTVRPLSHQLLGNQPERLLLTAEKEAISQVFEAREMLEMSIVDLAARRASPSAIEEIRSALEREIAQDHGDYDHHRRLNNDFHLAVAAACGNPVLVRMLTPLLGGFGIFLGVRPADEQVRRTRSIWADLHRAIYEAIRDHEPAAARRAMRAHAAFSAEERAAALQRAFGGLQPDHSPGALGNQESEGEIGALRSIGDSGVRKGGR